MVARQTVLAMERCEPLRVVPREKARELFARMRMEIEKGGRRG